MIEIEKGCKYLMPCARDEQDLQEVTFADVGIPHRESKVTLLSDGITEFEFISVLISRLNYRYASIEHPDIKSAIRKIKEANYLLAPHLGKHYQVIEEDEEEF